ncbi:DUF402 domain-containing protein [Niallia sp. 01092]|uniref:DUF402 domain-containing protein n=1 Tax=unclassified Niallia TaxID=2837522 RepID=UPI003FD49293
MTFQTYKKVIEKKVRYDNKVVEHSCLLLQAEPYIVLFHKITDSFTMTTVEGKHLTISEGSYTTAFYWKDRPYNVYLWRDSEGNYLGCYFNIVKNTYRTDAIVCFEDLMIDVLVLPNGQVFILDEDELPEPIEQFEKGQVQKALTHLTTNMEIVLSEVFTDIEKSFPHENMLLFLNQ